MDAYSGLRGFALAHRGGGELHGGADPLTSDGHRLWARCSCGARSCSSTSRVMSRWPSTSSSSKCRRMRSGRFRTSLPRVSAASAVTSSGNRRVRSRPFRLMSRTPHRQPSYFSS